MAFSAHDIVSDSPTNNFCTLNPLGISTATLSDGNLKAQQTNAAYGGVYFSTFSIPKIGKYYIECLLVSVQGNQIFGLYNTDTTKRFIYDVYYSNGSGRYYTDGTAGTPSTGGLSSGTIIAIYIDSDSLTANFFINNNILSSPSYSLTPDTDYFLTFNGNNSGVSIYNFGQDPTFGGNKNTPATVNGETGPFAPSGTAAGTAGLFYYPPPTGALALCTANLPDFTPTVTGDTPQYYFKAVKYDGDGSNNRNITSVGFQPDLVWLKARSVGASNGIYDSVRGAANWLRSDGTSAEQYQRVNGYLNSFDSNGFTLAEGSSTDPTYTGIYETNQSGQTYVAWCWKAGGPPDLTSSPTKPFAKDGVQYETLSAANITAGTITPTAMSVNTDAGFSIVKYTGTGGTPTVPHGLSSPPEFVIFKSLGINNWTVITPLAGSLSSGTYLFLNSPQEAKTSTDFNAMALNVSTITLDTSTALNSTFSYIAYCWHSVEGYSKFGSYTGNGSPDGPFVYCGFRPAWVMCKGVDTSSYWVIHDNARDGYNGNNKDLYASLPQAEASSNMIDILSGGFKIRHTTNQINGSGPYIFMAFAEQPFKFSNAR